MTPTTQDAGIDLDSEIEALALKHIAPQFRDLFPSLDYKCGEQFDRIRAFAVELLARRTPARVGEAAPIAQPTAGLGDEQIAPTTSTVSAPEEVRNQALAEGLEMAARHLDKQRQAVDQDHAYQEPDTGAWVFDRPETEEYSNTLAELADEIRALKRTTSGKGEAA
jgi:hypothetical protein